MPKMLTIFASIFLVGCTSTNDINTFALLNQRLTNIETRMSILESKSNNVPYIIQYDRIPVRDNIEYKTATVTQTNIVTICKTVTNNVYEHTILIQNSNGSSQLLNFELRNGKWYGPHGESYESIPKKRDVEKMYKL